MLDSNNILLIITIIKGESMARNRMIKPDFWADEKMGMLSINARMLYISLWNFADDEGLLRWIPELLKSQAFLYDDIEIKPLMNELIEASLVFIYQGKTPKGQKVQRYAWVVNFHKHQKIDRPQRSKLPPPSLQSSKVKAAYETRDNMTCHICKEKCRTGNPNICNSPVPSLDHVKPRSKGGSNYPSNIKVAHLSCNRSKGDKYQSLNDDTESFDEQFGEFVATKEKDKEKDKEKEQRAVVFDFDLVYKNFPRKEGKSRGMKKCKSQITTEKNFQDLKAAVENYAKLKADTEKKYIKNFGNWMDEWEDYIIIPEEDRPMTLDEIFKECVK